MKIKKQISENQLSVVDKAKAIKTLIMIADDMKNDAMTFDGRPFDGRTVAEYFGNQGAAIAALANILRLLLEVEPEANQ